MDIKNRDSFVFILQSGMQVIVGMRQQIKQPSKNHFLDGCFNICLSIIYSFRRQALTSPSTTTSVNPK
jgi:hypothetical protein